MLNPMTRPFKQHTSRPRLREVANMMTKKHYALLAAILHSEVMASKLTGRGADAERNLIRLLCHALKKDNPRFNSITFLEKSGFNL